MKPSTKYKVFVKKGISDIYEQNLSKPWSKGFDVLDITPNLIMPSYNNIALIERLEGTKIKIKSINNKAPATITMVKIDSDDVFKSIISMRNYYWSYRGRRSYGKNNEILKPELGKDGRISGSPGPASKIKGKRISFKKRLNRRKNEMETTLLDINKILKGKGGMVFVEIYSPDLNSYYYRSPYKYMLVQVTDMGLTARYDEDNIIVMATGLKSGKTLANTKLSLYKRANVKKYRSTKTEKI